MRSCRRFIEIASCAALLVLFFSCRTSRSVVSKSGEAELLTGEAHLEAVISNAPFFDVFSSRLRLTLPGKKEKQTLNGSLKISRDRLIRISLQVPIIRTEAARIEITPDRVLVIDRINRRYTVAPVARLKALFKTDVDYPMLQSLFSNGIFLPGKPAVVKGDYQGFRVDYRRSDKVILSRRSGNFVCSFAASFLTNRLLESTVESAGSKMIWQYGGFETVGNTVFPSEMVVKVGTGNSLYQTTMELTRMSVGGGEIKQTDLPSRYEELPLEDLMEMLGWGR